MDSQLTSALPPGACHDVLLWRLQAAGYGPGTGDASGLPVHASRWDPNLHACPDSTACCISSARTCQQDPSLPPGLPLACSETILGSTATTAIAYDVQGELDNVLHS